MMSMHLKPTTPSEETGLRAHGLPVGKPSQLADAFRLGMAWGKAELVRERIAVAKTRGALITRAMRHPVVLEIMADCADCMDTENSASCDHEGGLYSSKLLGEAKELRAEAAKIRSEDPELWESPPGSTLQPAAWHPMATAPGNEILLLAAEFDGPGDWRIKCGYRDDENGRGWKVWGASWQPTRWMRMPAPPATTAPCSADSKPCPCPGD